MLNAAQPPKCNTFDVCLQAQYIIVPKTREKQRKRECDREEGWSDSKQIHVHRIGNENIKIEAIVNIYGVVCQKYSMFTLPPYTAYSAKW